MRTILTAGAALLAAGCMAEPPVGASAALDAALAADLQGRSAGAPQRCVALRELRGNRSAGDRAILFDGMGGTIWVNRPPAGCEPLRDGRALSVRTVGSQLCAGDMVGIFDPLTGTEFGACALGEFTPWRRAP